MKLETETDIPARLFRAAYAREGEDRMAAALIARATFDWRGEELVLAAEQPWIVSPEPWESPAGPHPGDQVLVREGVDVLCFATARTPGGEPRREHRVAVSLGDWRREVRVVGRRVWEKRLGRGFVATAPEPFTQQPLDLGAAYGGSDEHLGLEMPFVDNPVGVGFVTRPERVAGTELPRLEELDRPATTWEEPAPVVGFGFCPAAYSKRLERSLEFNDQGALLKIRAGLFNHAWPEMIAPRASAGDEVVLEGVDPAGPRRCRLPALGLRVALRFGEREDDQPLPIDQVGLEPDANRVFITYRFPFRYGLRPLELRRCVLYRSDASARAEEG